MLFGNEILTSARMRAIESAAMKSGEVSGLALMEPAGEAVAGHIRLRWPKPGHAVVLCGPGNNGGDGYVIARHLAQAGWLLRVLGTDNDPGPDAAEMKRRWREIGAIGRLSYDEFRQAGRYDLYVDALFGTGLTRPLAGDLALIMDHIGGSAGDQDYFRQRFVAVDCPSGLCLDSGTILGHPRGGREFDPHARVTVTFDSPKVGHLLERGPEICGELVVADIGLQKWREKENFAPQDGIWPVFPIADIRRSQHAKTLLSKQSHCHKYSHGHALIIAGGAGRGGAARLAARAALRIGAGLVTICPPNDAIAEYAGTPDALMRRGLDDAGELRGILQDQRIRSICLGPGTGVDRAEMMLPAILESDRPCLLDADALTALADDPGLQKLLHPYCVLTSHAGEFARLFPDIAERLGETSLTGPAYSRIDATRDAAKRCGAVVFLKGPDTVVASPDGRAKIHSAYDVPWLATAGSGDVLAGLICGLISRGMEALDAAGIGALIHAKSARHFGPGLIADDLPEQVPAILRELGVR